MDQFEINGGNRLKGTVEISGAKNAALLAIQILAAQDPSLKEAYRKFKADQAQAVAAKNRALQEKIGR